MGKNKYVYPKLYGANGTYSFVRFSGSGLANGLFVWARAIIRAEEIGAKLISPTWFNISLGPYIRKELDKRHYVGLFIRGKQISGLKKWYLLNFRKLNVEVVEGMGDYFKSLLNHADLISSYIESHINPALLVSVKEFDFRDCIAVHIRLGDYPENVRVPIEWYKQRIMMMREQNPSYRFLIFSDGRDEELSELTRITNVTRVNFGSAISDIIAISKCAYLIGSDSTFSGWGAFLGQVPCVFYRKHYGPVLKDRSKEIVLNTKNMWK